MRSFCGLMHLSYPYIEAIILYKSAEVTRLTKRETVKYGTSEHVKGYLQPQFP
jgi:hypothetical protein